MRIFARSGCRAVVMCGTIVIFGSATPSLRAQDAQDISRSDVLLFDQFLDAHADIDAQLRAKPSLLTDAEYLEAHPQLEKFLNQHPQVQTQLRENSSYFMEREKRFDANEARRRSQGDADVTRREVATMDEFLDRNQNIDRDLRRNPALVNNAEYLEAHPQLQAFLSRHPDVKEEITENPRYFMQRENRFESQESDRRTANPARANQNPNPDLNRQELASMDQFLDKNPNIERDLWRNPSMVSNAEYLQAHPELQAFLNQHPNVKEEIAENPRYFMQRENRFEAQETEPRTSNPTRANANPNPDLNRQELASMDQFLDKNPSIERDLWRNPSMVSNAQYLQAHPELQAFLNQHPNVKEEIAENPRYFMQRENRFEAQETERRTTNPARSNANPNPDLNRQELASMDQFLDRNQNIDQDLRRNPGLVSNAEYLEAHPQLQSFLSQHPEVKEEITENPRYFMQRENRYEAQEPAQRRNSGNPNPDLNRQEIATMDQFLDRNQSIDQDLRRNPGLVNNAEYLEAHPQLQSFLNQHPNVKEEITENPRYFMQRENRFEAQGSPRRDVDRDADARSDRDFRNDRDRDANRNRDFDRRNNPNPDLNQRELSSMDDFLDRHQDVAKSLERKPDLVNDRKYLKRHRDLDEFLSEHPAVREEVRENPTYFMNRENQFEARNMDRDALDRDRARDTDRDRARDNDRGRSGRDLDADLNKKELKDMDRFLDKHKKIEKDLRKNPSLVNDHDYMRHHKSLESFLSKNPKVGEEMRENPSAFMRSQERLEARNHRVNQSAVKPKTKIEQKEEMKTATPH